MRAIFIFFISITLLQIQSVQAGEVITNEAAKQDVPQTYSELEAAIDEIVKYTNTQGLAVAMVGEQHWQYTTGYADASRKREITSRTQFRVGSISKVFVALSILTLVEQGELTLDTPIKEVLPGVEFDNPWRESVALCVHHLLEHTTGWDAPDFNVLAHNSLEPIAREQALALSVSSRTSRWPPGSRTAYNNEAYEVAALIVEKLSGQRFEDYVKASFFLPLGMNNTGYFFTEYYKKQAAILYRGKQAQPYQNLPFRAAGAINSDLHDMKILAQYLLEQSQNDLLVANMEKPYRSLALQQGVEVGFGLGLNRFNGNEHRYFGVEGALRGANSLVAYQKQLNVAHVILSNSESPALSQINKLLINFQTQHEAKKTQSNQRDFHYDEIELSGFYRPISSSNTRFAFLTELMSWRLTITQDSAIIKPLLGGQPRQLFNTLSRGIRQSGTGDVVLASGVDPIEGKVIYYGPQTLAPISAVAAYLPLITVLLVVLFSVVTLFICIPWLFFKTVKGKFKQPSTQLIALPSFSGVFFALALFMIKVINNQVNVFELVSTVNVYTFLFLVFGLLFILGCFYNLFYLFQHRPSKKNAIAFVFSISFSALGLIVFGYLIIQGSIAFM